LDILFAFNVSSLTLLFDRYDKQYFEQNQLTKSFRQFATNLLHAFRGKNTVESQLQAHDFQSRISLAAYSDVGNAEVSRLFSNSFSVLSQPSLAFYPLQTLPLGPEFQAQVNLYVDYGRSTAPSLVASGLQPEVANIVRTLEAVSLLVFAL
jgi:hypothetical protein